MLVMLREDQIYRENDPFRRLVVNIVAQRISRQKSVSNIEYYQQYLSFKIATVSSSTSNLASAYFAAYKLDNNNRVIQCLVEMDEILVDLLDLREFIVKPVWC
jgi:hypothetical protein